MKNNLLFKICQEIEEILFDLNIDMRPVKYCKYKKEITSAYYYTSVIDIRVSNHSTKRDIYCISTNENTYKEQLHHLKNKLVKYIKEDKKNEIERIDQEASEHSRRD